MLTDRFWIVTHEGWLDVLGERVAAMSDGRLQQGFGGNGGGHVATGGGHVVNVSTDHVHRAPGVRTGGGASMDLYDASKWAIRGLTEAWAVALHPHGIRVNELCMGATDGPMLREFVGDHAGADTMAAWLRPEDVARVLVELLSEGPDGRTGTQIGMWVGHSLGLGNDHANEN